ncbi:Uncharacterized protein dnm_005700 [Desulfonema magnum]|uniref:Uncharacterized protein n=1 Tax=Desulfonema magnum TaxID=45655 RepID=A0A975BFP4_9BACT|nr:Uncharacterized protein dnm_005700 [Desulfonema magnum]
MFSSIIFWYSFANTLMLTELNNNIFFKMILFSEKESHTDA